MKTDKIKHLCCDHCEPLETGHAPHSKEWELRDKLYSLIQDEIECLKNGKIEKCRWDKIKKLLEEAQKTARREGYKQGYNVCKKDNLDFKLMPLTKKQVEIQARRETTEQILGVLEGMKKRLDVGDFGVDSVSFPSGEIWTQEKRVGFNQALFDFAKEIKEKFMK